MSCATLGSVRGALLFGLAVCTACQSAATAPRAGQITAPPSASARAACTHELTTVHGISGVIFGPGCPDSAQGPRSPSGDSIQGYWQPTRADIDRIEASLRPTLERGLKHPEAVVDPPADEDARSNIPLQISEVLGSYARYRRQYVGIVVGTARRVLVSSFLEPTPATPEFPDWTTRWVDVDDGGTEFWRIEYDVASGRFSGFEVNASA